MLEQVRFLNRRVITTLIWVALVVVSGALALLHLLDAIDVQQQQLAYESAERMAVAETMASAQQERSANARGYLLTGDPGFLERRRSAREEFAFEVERMRALRGSERQLDMIAALAARLTEGSDRSIALWPMEQASAVAQWDREVRPIQEQLSRELRALATGARADYESARKTATASAREGRRLSVALGLAVLVALVVLFLQFARTSRELLRSVQDRQERIMFRLLDQVPVGIFVLDRAGKPYFVNRIAERLIGRPAQFQSQELTRTYHAFEAGTERPYPVERTPIMRALAGEISEVSDMEIRRDGEVTPLLVHGCPVFDDTGQLTHAVAAFQNVSELTRKALLDALTGLSNRAALSQSFSRERLLCERTDKRLGVSIIDIDHFKAVNDQHGHAAGDSVLKRVARMIVGVLRRTDVVGRWGGEEFVLLLPGSDPEGLRLALEKALSAVRQESFPGKDHAAFKITFSAGAVLAEHGESLDSCVARADALLYRAKEAGRNRIMFDAEPLPVALRG